MVLPRPPIFLSISAPTKRPCSNHCSLVLLDSRQQTPVLPWNDVSISVLQLKENREWNRLLTTGNVWITAVLSSLTIDKQNYSWKGNISKHRGSRCSSITDTQLNFWKRKSVRRRRLSITKCTPAGPTSPQPRRFVVADDRQAKFEALLRKGLLWNKIAVFTEIDKDSRMKSDENLQNPFKISIYLHQHPVVTPNGSLRIVSRTTRISQIKFWRMNMFGLFSPSVPMK